MSETKKGISYQKLLFQSIPEFWNFQLISNIFLLLLIAIFRKLTVFIISAKAPAITTSNIGQTLDAMRLIILIPIGLLFIFIYVATGLFSQIYLTDSIIKGETGSVIKSIKKGFLSIIKFFTPSGFLILFFILVAVPLVGIGMSINLTENFYIPNFIMSAIEDNNYLYAIYVAVMILFTVLVLMYFFSIHGVLLGGLSAKEAKKHSTEMMKKNWKNFFISMLLFLLGSTILSVAVIVFVIVGSKLFIHTTFKDMPINYVVPNLLDIDNLDALTDADANQILYRIVSIFFIIISAYIILFIELILSSTLILQVTRLYHRYNSKIEARDEKFYPRPKRRSYIRKIIFMFAVPVVILFVSIILGFTYDDFFVIDDIPIVAHRLGGDTAAENSIAGLENSISEGCYGFETDVQRTKDGHYIINHDDTFKRLTGVNKASYEMTLDEIKKLKLHNPDGTFSHVITLEELLDASKGHGILFIELKGKTADKQMVDDVVRIVKEKDCVNDVALISLKYDVIEYAEEKYPEFETGILFFAGIGDFEKLNCDILIMEEEMAFNYDVDSAHDVGKKVMVWTVNSEDNLYRFLNTNIDGIITDSIYEATDIKEDLKERSDYDVIYDRLKIL